jgi:CRISPR-associated exonuclease Cas4
MNDDDLLPIRYLNDLLFCERRAALHLNEQIWQNNQFTTEGLLAHRRVDLCKNMRRGEARKITGMWLVSNRLGLIGKADLIEMNPDASGNLIPYPIDFKRGKKRRWDNNEVQLCAQGICLEEMLGVIVPVGAIFHIKSQRREEVEFDSNLRELTQATAKRLRELIESRETPMATFQPKCRGCSLLNWCMPKSLRVRTNVKSYLNRIINQEMPPAEIDSL